MGPIVCILLVHNKNVFFLCTPLTFLPLPGGGGCGHAIPPFLILDSKWAQSFVFRQYMIVYFFFCLYTFYFSTFPRGLGICYPPFFDFGFENGLNHLYFVIVHDCIRLFFVCTPLTFLPRPGGLGTRYPPFFDFGFENGLNCLYFVST